MVPEYPIGLMVASFSLWSASIRLMVLGAHLVNLLIPQQCRGRRRANLCAMLALGSVVVAQRGVHLHYCVPTADDGHAVFFGTDAHARNADIARGPWVHASRGTDVCLHY